MKRTYIYAGSFDPPTLGHLNVIEQARALCDHLIVAVGKHATKSPLFSLDEKIEMLHCMVSEGAQSDRLSLRNPCSVDVVSFDGLIVDLARAHHAHVLIRGLRDSTDFDYEMQMAQMNTKLAPDVQTVFLPASADTRHITATLVRQIAAMGGDISQFVPAYVAKRLALQFAAR